MTDDEITRLQADARGAAALRRAFHRAAEEFHAAGIMSPAQQRAWATLYEAVRDSTAGLAVGPRLPPGQRAELDALYADSVARETAGEVWAEYTGPGQ